MCCNCSFCLLKVQVALDSYDVKRELWQKLYRDLCPFYETFRDSYNGLTDQMFEQRSTLHTALVEQLRMVQWCNDD